MHGTDPGFEMRYAKAAVVAMKALSGDLGPRASMDYLIAAARNTLNPPGAA